MAKNYGEMLAVLEYLDRKTAVKTPKATRFGGGMKRKKFDLVELLREKKEETEMLEKFLEEQTKLKKKDDKKEEKKRQFIGLEWYVIGLLSYPVMMFLQAQLQTVVK